MLVPGVELDAAELNALMERINLSRYWSIPIAYCIMLRRYWSLTTVSYCIMLRSSVLVYSYRLLYHATLFGTDLPVELCDVWY